MWPSVIQSPSLTSPYTARHVAGSHTVPISTSPYTARHVTVSHTVPISTLTLYRQARGGESYSPHLYLTLYRQACGRQSYSPHLYLTLYRQACGRQSYSPHLYLTLYRQACGRQSYSPHLYLTLYRQACGRQSYSPHLYPDPIPPGTGPSVIQSPSLPSPYITRHVAVSHTVPISTLTLYRQARGEESYSPHLCTDPIPPGTGPSVIQSPSLTSPYTARHGAVSHTVPISTLTLYRQARGRQSYSPHLYTDPIPPGMWPSVIQSPSLH